MAERETYFVKLRNKSVDEGCDAYFDGTEPINKELQCYEVQTRSDGRNSTGAACISGIQRGKPTEIHSWKDTYEE